MHIQFSAASKRLSSLGKSSHQFRYPITSARAAATMTGSNTAQKLIDDLNKTYEGELPLCH